MQSNRFLRIAEDIARKDKQLFDAFLEFEQTKRIRTKERLNFTIDRSVASRFKKFCREKSYNMSSKVENALRGIMDKEQ